MTVCVVVYVWGCVWVYTCVNVHVCQCVCVAVYVWECVRVHVCGCACVSVCMCIWVCAYMSVRVYDGYVIVWWVWVCVNVYKGVCVCSKKINPYLKLLTQNAKTCFSAVGCGVRKHCHEHIQCQTLPLPSHYTFYPTGSKLPILPPP